MNKKYTYVEQLENQIKNMLYSLNFKRIIYFYLPINKNIKNKNEITLSWNNHKPGKFNTGKSFLILEQYKRILDNNSYTCILYDGSIIRISYKFKEDILIGHNLLWWPAPYVYEGISMDDISPQELFEEFIQEKKWNEILRMRSPVRIDFDPNNVTEIHSAIHMHMQHENCRIIVDKPVCFNKFIKFLLENYYPQVEFFIDESEYINFNYDDNYDDIEYSNSRIIL